MESVHNFCTRLPFSIQLYVVLFNAVFSVTVILSHVPESALILWCAKY